MCINDSTVVYGSALFNPVLRYGDCSASDAIRMRLYRANYKGRCGESSRHCICLQNPRQRWITYLRYVVTLVIRVLRALSLLGIIVSNIYCFQVLAQGVDILQFAPRAVCNFHTFPLAHKFKRLNSRVGRVAQSV
jgi:hypothetical protein